MTIEKSALVSLADDGLLGTLPRSVLVGHPELRGKRELVIDTLQHADAVFLSKRDPSTRIYIKRYADIMLGDNLIEQTTLRVYVRESDGFVVTAYFAAAWWRSLGEKQWPL